MHILLTNVWLYYFMIYAVLHVSVWFSHLQGDSDKWTNIKVYRLVCSTYKNLQPNDCNLSKSGCYVGDFSIVN